MTNLHAVLIVLWMSIVNSQSVNITIGMIHTIENITEDRITEERITEEIWDTKPVNMYIPINRII